MSVSANATVPTSSPIVVAAKRRPQVRRERRDVAMAERGEARREGNQRAHQAERGTGAHEDPRVLQAPLDRELVVGERVLDPRAVAGEHRGCDLHERIGRERAGRAPGERGGLPGIGEHLAGRARAASRGPRARATTAR